MNVTITILPAPVVNAGSDQSACANNNVVNLAGSVTIGATTGKWTTSGDGVFSLDTDLNASYTPGTNDISNTTITLTLTATGGCSPVADDMIITITPAPTVDAGSPQTICGVSDIAVLSGSVSDGASTGIWTTSGDGSFSLNTDLSASYSPGTTDISAGSVLLTLTSTGFGNCNSVNDNVVISITSPPIVDAGSDVTVCANNADVNLAGAISGGATAGIWTTSGDGSFSVDTDLNGIYTPGTADITNTNVNITLSSTDGCDVVSDNFIITITPSPIVNAGTDQIVCETSPNATLSASVSGGATTGIWTTSGDGVFSLDTDLSATYSPGTTDISSGLATLTLTSTGYGNCNSVNDQILINILPAPFVDAGSDQIVCESSPDASLSGSVTIGSTTGIWTSSGTGSFSSNTDLNATYSPSAADITAGSVNLTLTATGGCSPIDSTIIITITPLPVVNAGLDQDICESVSSINLSGSITVGGTNGKWSTSGTGTFADENNLNTTYSPSLADINTNTIIITLTSTDGCSVVTDNFILNIHTQAIVDAGSDATVCSNNSLISLYGNIISSNNTGIWTTNGSGTFSVDTDLNTIYIPSDADTTVGVVIITLTSTNNQACPAISSSLTINLTPAPYVNAGSDEFVCANNPNVSLNSNIFGASNTGIWSTGGTGSFSPDNLSLNATYIPSDADTALGLVTLVLSSTNIGTCLEVKDSMQINIAPAPTALAGNDIYLCNTDLAQLNGQIIFGSGSGKWTTNGTGHFTPSDTSLNAIYTPGSADTLNGSVQFILTSINNGGCIAVYDTLDLFFTPRPFVEAGNNQTICANNTAILSGVITGSSTTGIWTSNGSGTFSPYDTSLNATYIPSLADEISGSVIITLNSTNACNKSDNLILTLDPTPIANAGTDITICESQNSVLLNGSITGATNTGIWTTDGTGIFSLNDTTLNANYYFSTQDSINGSVSLTLTSTNNADCLAESDSINIIIERQAIVDAGLNVITCSNNTIVDLNGNIGGGTITGLWTSTGTGSFYPNDSSLIASYTPSVTDISLDSITINLSSTNNGECSIINNDLLVSFTPSPLVDAGADANVCANNSTVNLNGTISGGASQGIWTTNGSGVFNPNNTDLNAVYIPSDGDTIIGNIILTLTSTDNGDCLPVSDSINVTITDIPYVNAGSDQIICSGDNASLNGLINSISGNGIWSTNGDGSFSNSSSLSTSYIPGINDANNGSAILSLTSVNVGGCVAITDSIDISITPRPIVNAGLDQTVCSNNNVQLTGSVTGSSTTGYWSTSGTGLFSPDSIAFNATYIPSNIDTANGGVTIYLNATNSCGASDSMIITLTTAPFVDAGSDQIICASENQINLNANVFGSTTTGIWSTTGSGTISANNTDLNGSHNITPTDTIDGLVEFILTSTNNGSCSSVSDTVNISITDIPTVNAGVDQTICANTQAQLSGSIIGIVNTGHWISSGSGTFLPDSTDLNAVYIPSYADTTAGFVKLILESIGACQIISDTIDIIITPAPMVNAGTDIEVCANNSNVILSALVWGATNTGLWTSSGTGNFNNNTDLNTTYIPSDLDTANGSLELILESTNYGICLPSYDTITVTITDIPYVNAGSDQIICSGDNASLNGLINSISGNGIWSTNGDGSFSNSSSLSTSYIPGINDANNGSAILSLTSVNVGGCVAITDSIDISITPRPIVNAGLDQTVCSNNNVQLTGSVTGSSTTGYWSTSGTGLFSPDSIAFNATYIPSNIDTANGGVTIYLNATNSCGASDSMIITLTTAPFVDAGSDQIICASENQINLNANVFGSTTTGIWSTTGSGTISANNTDLNGSYNITPTDTIDGLVEFILTSTNNGSCSSVSDTVNISITDIPTVNAGVDQTICANNIVSLSGIITGQITNGMWSSLGTGIFLPDSTNLNTNYFFSDADTAAGFINLVLESVGSCQVIYDTMNVTITPSPHIYAGQNLTVCSNNSSISLTGQIWGSTTTGKWSTNGTGSFIPSDTALNATYIPSDADTTDGSVIITLDATNIGICLPESDSLIITFTRPSVADAGTDIYVCNDGNAYLDGDILFGYGTGIWTTDGTGSFNFDTSHNAIYYPSINDTVLASINLILTSTNNLGCIADSDTMQLYFTQKPYVNAGPNTSMCSDDTLSLNGIISGSSSSGFWATLGNGEFLQDSSDLTGSYVPSNADADSNFISLILTSTNSCPETDTLIIEFAAPISIANSGADEIICSGGNTVQLAGNVIGVDTTGIWSTLGTGTFTPNNTDLDATYILSNADTTAGFVDIILTSTTSGSCGFSSDTMRVSISEIPIINAGIDIVSCANNNIILSGTSSSPNNVWSTSGTGYFLPDSSDLAANYVLSPADTISGFISIYLYSYNSCGQSFDTINVSITPTPFVNTVEDSMIVCANYPNVLLNGIISSNTNTGTWSTNGSGVFTPSAMDLNATYIPDSLDIINGSVVLKLKSSNNGDCYTVSDSIFVKINPTPIVNAGIDLTICNGSTVDLDSAIISSESGTGIWSTLGNGTFAPNDSTINGSYIANQDDLDLGHVDLILNTTNLDGCIAQADTITAHFMTSNSGIEIIDYESICFGDSVHILPVINGDTGTIRWTTSEQASFFPSDSVFNISYLPNSNDVDSRQAYIYMQYDYACGSVSDSILVSINAKPEAMFASSWNCNSQSIEFTDTSKVHNGAITYCDWDLGDGNTHSGATFTNDYQSPGDYEVTLIVRSDSSCYDTTYKSIHVWEPVIANFSVFDTNVMVNEEVLFVDESSGAVSWYWLFGDGGSISDIQDPTYAFNDINDYIVWLFIEGENSCVDSSYINIKTYENGFGIASGFSPNNDQLNDEFYVRGGQFVEFKLQVYNSWGQQIFESSDQNNKWDGKYQGKDQPEGVYIYVFIGMKSDGTTIEKTGDLTLIR